jgi:hypothetical protein
MQSLQERVLEWMEKVAKDRRVELSQTQHYNNTGLVHVHRYPEKSVQMHYDFQSNHCTLKFPGSSKDTLLTRRYDYSEYLDKMMDDVEKFVKTGTV